MDQFNPQWKRLSRPITEPSDIRSIFREFIQAYTRPVSLQQPGSKPPSAMSSLLQFTGGGGGGGSGGGEPTSGHADASPELGAETVEGSVAKVSLKRTTGWLSLLLEALTAAVAAAAALDGQDAAAQQQLQQEKLLCQTAEAATGTAGNGNAELQERLAGMQTQGACVLVLGQQGRDRTLLVSSLVQIILAPGVRTIRGFEALIYRDWLLAGHAFGETCRHSAFSMSLSQRDSPIFLLFLDCVWQIWCQYPSCFEFNEDFLIFLAKHAYVSEFGTFLGNSEQDRENLELASKTISLWSYVNRPEVLANFLNPLYSAPSAGTDGSSASTACWPCLAPQALTVWAEVYQKQLLGTSQNSLAAHRQLLSHLHRDFTDTKLTVRLLRQLVSNLQEEAVSAGLTMARTGA
uniref:Myotubularin phosphatase domain-containing protein n=3 Tax=Schistocephalus solidus TaxID=70667 RepID=A0A0X3NS00_SCHSO